MDRLASSFSLSSLLFSLSGVNCCLSLENEVEIDEDDEARAVTVVVAVVAIVVAVDVAVVLSETDGVSITDKGCDDEDDDNNKVLPLTNS